MIDEQTTDGDGPTTDGGQDGIEDKATVAEDSPKSQEEAPDESDEPPESSSPEEESVDSIDSPVLSIAVRELKWWFPSSLAIAGLATTIALFFANQYYDGYYTVFGLTVDQVGITRTGILFHLIPFGIAVASMLLIVRLVLITMFTPRGGDLDSENSGLSRKFQIGIVGGVGGLSILLVFVIGALASEAGHNDAEATISRTSNDLYVSAWQSFLGIQTGKASFVEWVGPADENVFKDLPTPENSTHFSAIRILSQIDETTVYFDLIDCKIHILPSIDLAITSGPTNFITSPSDAHSTDLPFKSCGSSS